MESTDVLIVGAGISGIGTACHLKKDKRDRSFVVLEARPSIGGTWDLFKYPGIRSDSDMFTFGFRFLPWTDGKDIAEGDAIIRYLNRAVDTFKIADHIRFRHRVESLSWSSPKRRWVAQASRLDEDGQPTEALTIEARFLVTGTGYYDYQKGYTPDWPGFETFEGDVVHPQHWQADLPIRNRKVVVVGSGATAVTLVPNLADAGARVTMLQRSPTYIYVRPAIDHFARRLRQVLPSRVVHNLTRMRNIAMQWGLLRLCRWKPHLVRKYLRQQAEDALGPDFDIDTHFKPHYDPWDQRLCLVPDGDFYAAIRNGSANVVTEHIERFEKDGIRLRSGEKIEADVVVPATGLRLKVLSNIKLDIDGHAVKPNDLVVYKGAMFGNMPNWISVFGYTAASWTLKADLVSAYLLRLLRHMEKNGYDVARPELSADEPAPDTLMQNLATAGYIQRGRDHVPRQGRRWPWRNQDNYLLDYLALRFGRIADGVMAFETSRGRSGHRFALRGKTAVVTGAASGIGRALSVGLARRGCHLALVDISTDGLEALVEHLSPMPVRVTTHRCDMGEAEAVQALASEVTSVHPAIDLVFNNAGVAMGGRFEDAAPDEFDRLLAVNLFGPINLTRALLKHLQGRPEARIVNISSIFGLIAPAGQVAYATSKFALRGFSESLRRELVNTSVGVTTVHPGGIQTSVAKNAIVPRGVEISEAERDESVRQFERAFRTSADQAAKVILRSVERRKDRVLVGSDAYVVSALARLSPTRNVELLGPTVPKPEGV